MEGGVCVRLTDEHPEGPHSPVPRKIMNHQPVPQISLCVLNARSVRGKKLERAVYICDYVVENQFDCVGITETWLSSEDADNVTTLSSLIPRNYKMAHFPRQGSTGGGVAFMHKEHYKVKVDKSYKASSFETMTVMLDAASYTFRFVIIYRIPPSNNNKLKKSLFVEELQTTLNMQPHYLEN